MQFINNYDYQIFEIHSITIMSSLSLITIELNDLAMNNRNNNNEELSLLLTRTIISVQIIISIKMLLIISFKDNIKRNILESNNIIFLRK